MSDNQCTDNYGESGESWFAVQVRPRYEKFVSNALKNKNIPDFLPDIK